MESAQQVNIIVGDRSFAISKPGLTVRAVLEAAGLDPETNLLIEVRANERVEFAELGHEMEVNDGARFEVKPRTYLIFVNGRERRVDKRVLTFDDVVALDPNPPPPGPDVEYTITFFNAVKPPKGTLIQGDEVVIKDGTRFNVRGTNRS
jgi:hypothetical protein